MASRRPSVLMRLIFLALGDDQHAVERVARAFLGGGEERLADQLLEHARRRFRNLASPSKSGIGGKSAARLREDFEMRILAADVGACRRSLRSTACRPRFRGRCRGTCRRAPAFRPAARSAPGYRCSEWRLPDRLRRSSGDLRRRVSLTHCSTGLGVRDCTTLPATVSASSNAPRLQITFMNRLSLTRCRSTHCADASCARAYRASADCTWPPDSRIRRVAYFTATSVLLKF